MMMSPENIDIAELTITNYAIAQWVALGWEIKAFLLLALFGGIFYLMYWAFNKYVLVDFLGE